MHVAMRNDFEHFGIDLDRMCVNVLRIYVCLCCLCCAFRSLCSYATKECGRGVYLSFSNGKMRETRTGVGKNKLVLWKSTHAYQRTTHMDSHSDHSCASEFGVCCILEWLANRTNIPDCMEVNGPLDTHAFFTKIPLKRMRHAAMYHGVAMERMKPRRGEGASGEHRGGGKPRAPCPENPRSKVGTRQVH